MLAVAATAATVDDTLRDIAAAGVAVVEVLEPSPTRRVVLGRAIDAGDGADAGIASALRGRGIAAVCRPDGGAALRAWYRDTEPVRIRDRFAVALAWSEHPRPADMTVLELGPGGFGSGHHPTTRMMLEALVDLVGGGERVLDVGCGSGVLSLAVAHLGAAEVVAVDMKPEAVEATRRNAEANDFAARIDARCVALAAVPGHFDLVVANVARAGVVALAPDLVGRTATPGHLLVGGLTPRQCDLVAGHLAPLGEVDRRAEAGWAMQRFASA